MKIFTTVFLFSILCSTALAMTEPVLNGLAIHKTLGSDQFLAALHIEKFSEKSEEILNPQKFSRMEMHIVADRISKMRFVNLWIHGIVINTSPKKQAQQENNIKTFKGFFKDSLVQGDKVVIEWSKETNTNIHLNDIHLGTIPDKDFYLMLLRVWVGLIPLSSDFRADLLNINGINTELLSYYGKLLEHYPEISPERIEEIKNWKIERIDNPQKIAQSSIVEKLKPKELKEIPKPKLPPIPKAAPPDNKAPSPAPEPEITSTPEAKILPASSKKLVAQNDADSNPSDIINNEKNKKPPPTKTPWDYKKYYKNNIMSNIRRNGIIYPSQAKKYWQEDSIVVWMVLDHDGNPIHLELEESSKYPLLETAAAETIMSASPYGKIPAWVPEEDRYFPVKITFKINRI